MNVSTQSYEDLREITTIQNTYKLIEFSSFSEAFNLTSNVFAWVIK